MFGRPEHSVAGGEQSDSDQQAASGPKYCRDGISHTAEGRIQGEPPVSPGQCTWERPIQIVRDSLAIIDGDQVDVLAEPAFGEMRARKSSAADEVDPITDVLAEKCQQMRDQMIALDLLGRDAKLLCDSGAFVSVHAQQSMTRRGAAPP